MSTTPTTPLRGPAPSLYRYLIDAIESGQAIDFHLRASKTKDGGVEFYIHPATVSGDTQDYITWPAPENENYDFLVNKRNTKEPDVERFKKELREHVEQQKHAPPPSPAAQPTDEAKLREVIEKALTEAWCESHHDQTMTFLNRVSHATDRILTALAPHLAQREPGDSDGEVLRGKLMSAGDLTLLEDQNAIEETGVFVKCTREALRALNGNLVYEEVEIRKSAQRGEGKP